MVIGERVVWPTVQVGEVMMGVEVDEGGREKVGLISSSGQVGCLGVGGRTITAGR